MKALVKIVVLSVALNFVSAIFPKDVAAQQVNDFGVFYDELGPYGQWIDYPGQGYVWQPNVGPDFVPYSTAGHWVNTEYGWTWASDYNWGWAPFHYGRWNFDESYGWLWIPGSEWGPAWVVWRSSPGYYGWAPMGPARYGYEYDDYDNYYVPNDEWVFVDAIYLGSPIIEEYYYPYYDNDDFIRYSYMDNNCFGDRHRVVNVYGDGDRGDNYRYVCGPSRDEVFRQTGNQVRNVQLTASNRPGQNLANDRLSIYRPTVNKVADNSRKPSPGKVISVNELSRSSQKNVAVQQKHVKSSNNVTNVTYVQHEDSKKSLPVMDVKPQHGVGSGNNSEVGKSQNPSGYKQQVSNVQQKNVQQQVTTPHKDVQQQITAPHKDVQSKPVDNSGYKQDAGRGQQVSGNSHSSYSAPSPVNSQSSRGSNSGSSRNSVGSSGSSQPSHESNSGSSHSSSGSVSHSSPSSSSPSSSGGKRR